MFDLQAQFGELDRMVLAIMFEEMWWPEFVVTDGICCHFGSSAFLLKLELIDQSFD